MTKILAFDIATTTGIGFYDTDKGVSQIECFSVRFEGKAPFDKEKNVRILVPPIIKQYQPDFIVMEKPLDRVMSYKKKPTKGANLLPDYDGSDEGGETTMNPGTVIMLNRLAAAVHVVAEGFRIPCEEVRPQTWQSIIPKQYPGNSKQKVKLYCDSLRIIGKNMDARDAAIIALWAAGRSQVLKLNRNVMEKTLDL